MPAAPNAPAALDEHFDIEEFLAREQAKDLLRFTTAGSVDDGKSTLIGRLLHDAKGAYEDQLKQAIRGGEIDFSLLTDGLRAERERHSPFRAELVGEHRVFGARHVGEQQRRPTRFDRPIGDLGDLEVRVDAGVDLGQFAGAP